MGILVLYSEQINIVTIQAANQIFHWPQSYLKVVKNLMRVELIYQLQNLFRFFLSEYKQYYKVQRWKLNSLGLGTGSLIESVLYCL